MTKIKILCVEDAEHWHYVKPLFERTIKQNDLPIELDIEPSLSKSLSKIDENRYDVFLVNIADGLSNMDGKMIETKYAMYEFAQKLREKSPQTLLIGTAAIPAEEAREHFDEVIRTGEMFDEHNPVYIKKILMKYGLLK